MNNGNNIKNIIKVTLATTALTFGVINFNSTSADAKTLTYNEAAQKIVKATKTAYHEKKKVTVKVTVPCAGNTVGKIQNAEIKTENAVSKFRFPEELEKGDVVDVWGWARLQHFDNAFNKGLGFDNKYKYNNNKSLTLTTTVNGKNKNFRNNYADAYYRAANIKELKEVTKGMTTKEKAWRIATWLVVDHGVDYSSKYNRIVDAKKIYKNHKYNKECGSNCEGLANTYTYYAGTVGLEVGEVSAKDHKINCIKIDGTVYYLSMQEVFSRNEEWVAYNDGIENATEEDMESYKSYLDECRVGSAAMGYPWELSESDYAMITIKEARKLFREMMGDYKKWNYGSFENYEYGKRTKDVAKLPNNK